MGRHVRPEVAPDHAPPTLELVALVAVVLGRDGVSDHDDAGLERSVDGRLLTLDRHLPGGQQSDRDGDDDHAAQDRPGHGSSSRESRSSIRPNRPMVRPKGQSHPNVM
jgi:hypothetical protein